jgi:hypothetical protein
MRRAIQADIDTESTRLSADEEAFRGICYLGELQAFTRITLRLERLIKDFHSTDKTGRFCFVWQAID